MPRVPAITQAPHDMLGLAELHNLLSQARHAPRRASRYRSCAWRNPRKGTVGPYHLCIFTSHETKAPTHSPSLNLNSFSFCATSISSLSTAYCSASLRCVTILALSAAPPCSFLRPAADPALLPDAFLRAAASSSPAGRDEDELNRPACSSARALSVSMRRACRSRCPSARSRRSVTKGPISERREASAADRVVAGMSS